MSADSLAPFVEALAADPPGPAGGSAAAAAVAMAAALTELVARKSDRPEDAERAAGVRSRALSLADADARAYAAVLAAQGDARRDALEGASDLLREIGEAAAELSALAAPLADLARPALRADVLTAVELAGAARRASAEMIRANLG